MEANKERKVCECGKEFIRSKFHPYIVSCPDCRKKTGVSVVKKEPKQKKYPIRISDEVNQIRFTQNEVLQIHAFVANPKQQRKEFGKVIMRKVGEHIGIGMALYEFKDNQFILFRSYIGKVKHEGEDFKGFSSDFLKEEEE